MTTSTDVVLCGFWPHAVAEVPGRFAVLPETAEPDSVRTRGRQNPAVITVVPADLLLDGLTDDRSLHSVGLPSRTARVLDAAGFAGIGGLTIGDLVARQIEQADAVLLTGELDEEWETEQLRILLRRLAPWASHPRPGDPLRPVRARTEPVSAITRGLRGHAVGVHEPLPARGVTACVFRARRPLHPARLHDALGEITAGVLRSRGHFWLASRPDVVMTWESAGDLTITPHAGWLDGQPGDHWAEADPERRLAAALDWDPYYGDRHHHLAFVGIDADPVRIHRLLDGCLLTDDELSRGEEHWRRLPDPFHRTGQAASPEPRP
ncbi:hypothetical protein Ait01nite_026100 [Actinoplanes italicus]|uniref:Cobalamin synthesis protein cobW-like protein n=1 Tax=Actinoplanes italicus TaxID=113567 RepID=A0A2T0KF68_9ACTN|nr:GTP-binding protein [Actinoplanes italicus]PRX22016.1 cobalamin synthesis protein cobW-like protein [Actinoplanes italicus]GIE29565.1 hypothetical protein Ait01nite_026100 [Actinoplanes italicus]